ncbi:cyclic pyranopterin monophosphate synthase [Geothrix rubra]|uniref:GTP 3',8-cyclase n=1 Tax=Geothrix rubra TaxID=2927977 RepID=A0ABQ5Q625_9BACT|nr:GTP 3',8-cyclase MoaA [Geothrix rubra]GLH69560.1 cyclic pyranopterin monophosphate synthase [Geothrix rubra]
MEPLDTLGRPLRALRLSVTDRCNFRCTYCMPREAFGPDHAFLPREALLTFEEIARLARISAGLGVTKLRLTGGEPLLRRELPALVRMLTALPGVDDLALTTNGALLPELAAPLRNAGLKRITVSLDTLNPDRFQRISDTQIPLSQVLAGLEAARAAGFGPLKLNCVVQHGVNDDEILDLAAFAREAGHSLRFIEFMDVGTTNGWRLDSVVGAEEIRRLVHGRWPLEPVDDPAGAVARTWRYRDGKGELGLIASVTAPFCRGCDRARISAEGRLYTCLFAGDGLDLKAFLRGGHSDADLAALLASRWTRRDDRYSERRRSQTPGLPKVEMSHIGG